MVITTMVTDCMNKKILTEHDIFNHIKCHAFVTSYKPLCKPWQDSIDIYPKLEVFR
jgi:hypothetical protein